MRFRFHFLWAVTAVLGLGLLLKFTQQPFLYGGFAFGLIALTLAFTSGRSKGRIIWYNLGAAALIMGAAELWLHTAPSRVADQPHTYFEGSYTYDYMGEHDILGYGPRLRGRVDSRKMFEKEVVYDATYTILEEGIRTSGSIDSAENAMLFFGGSYMFGEGLDDQDTLPFAMQDRLDTPWAMYNFGFHGYGPHQMVASLEHHMVTDIVHHPVSHVFFMTAGFHIGRPSGVSQLNGPCYELDGDGLLERHGFFEEALIPTPHWQERLQNQADKSNIYQHLTKPRYLQGAPEFALYMALVREARDLVKEQFPDAQFSVLVWTENNQGMQVKNQLDDEEFVVYRVEDALDPSQTRMHYQHGPHDGHPNALAFAALADYLADLLEPGTAIQ